jgi:transmembrane sensor
LKDDASEASVIDLTARRATKARPTGMRPGLAAGLAVAIAASVAVVIGTGPKTVVYETRPGELQEIALDDGSVIQLNGGSRISVRLGRRDRRVEMDLAEASFDVAKDARRPFIIEAGQSQVRVVGTEFNVNRSVAATTVTVRRGVVEVRPLQGASAPVRLTPGQELSDAGGGYRVRRTNPDAAFAWKGGRLIYADEPLSEIAADLSRRFPTPVVVEGPAASLRFTGVLVLDDPDAVVSRLEAFLPITAHRSERSITLSNR